MTPSEIIAAVEAFKDLEPEIQKGIGAIIHLFHKKKQPATAPMPTTPPSANP
jgi:hypothetical protein